jgi:transcriptional regulator with XRE-family HTH domain
MTNEAVVVLADVDDELTAARIGFRLETLRIGAGLTAAELALQVGITPTALRELEDGLRLPSIGTLYNIARVYRIELGEMLPGPVSGVRAEMRLPMTDDPGSASALVVANGPQDPTRTYLFDLQPGEGGGISGHPGEELLVVTEGQIIRTTEGSADELLTAGESRVIDTTVHHGFRATDAGPARFLLVATDAPCDL